MVIEREFAHRYPHSVTPQSLMASAQRATPPGDAPLTLVTLGRAGLFRAREDAEPVLGPGKPLALLVYLHCSHARLVSREHLLDIFWADLDRAAALHGLRQLVWRLRRLLGPAAIVTRGSEVGLDAALDCDRDAFLAALDRGDPADAVACYQGPFFPEFAAPGGAAFEHWAEAERTRLRRLFTRAAEQQVRRHLAESRFRDGQALARRLIDQDAPEESAWRLLLEVHLAAGDRVQAIMEASRLRQWLAEEERQPEPATARLLELADAESERTAGAAEPGRMAAELVGREREFAAVIQAWSEVKRGRGRRIHLVAPAGLGKTRLLSDTANRLRTLGARVVALRAKPGERDVPYALAGELALALGSLPGAAGVAPATASELVSLSPALSSRFASAEPRRDDGDTLRRRSAALAELAAAVADEAPIALLLDDLHWADDSSVRVIGALLGRIENSAVLAVLAARPGYPAVVSDPGDLVLHLDPLTPAQVESLIESLGTVAEWGTTVARAIHRSTGGSPLLVLETLQLALDQQLLSLAGDEWRCADPALVLFQLFRTSALSERVGALRAADRRLLLVLAAAGSPVTTDALVAGCELLRDEIDKRLAALEQGGYVVGPGGAWQTAHDEIADAALAAATDDERRAARRAAGEALLTGGPAPAALPRIARHFHAAGESQMVKQLFVRWLALQREAGDRRPVRRLAAEFIGPADAATVTRAVPWRLRVPVSGRAVALASVGMVAAGTIGIAAMVRPEGPSPDVRVFGVSVGAHGEGRLVEAALSRAAWSRQPIPVRDDGLLPRGTTPDNDHISIVNGAWLYNRTTGDSGVEDLFLRDGSHERRLTYAARDDIGPDAAPDQSAIAFSSTRWSPEEDDNLDIAILDSATGAVRQLTHGPASDKLPAWSPDGSRIAFERIYTELRPDQICWTTVDGAREHCLPPPAQPVRELLGWRGTRELLVAVDAPEGTRVAVMDALTGDATLLDTPPLLGELAASADGQWIAGQIQPSGERQPCWYLFPTDAPDQRRRLAVSGSAWVFVQGLTPAPHLARVEIDSVTNGVALEATHQLSLRGISSDGSPMDLAAGTVEWSSADTRIAQVDSTGLLTPIRAGRVVIRVSVGGWRGDSMPVEIRPRGYRMALREDWHNGIDSAWVPYGSPAPQVVSSAAGPAFWNHGDGTFASGVFSRLNSRPTRGSGSRRSSRPLSRRLSGRRSASRWLRSAPVPSHPGSSSPARSGGAHPVAPVRWGTPATKDSPASSGW